MSKLKKAENSSSIQNTLLNISIIVLLLLAVFLSYSIYIKLSAGSKKPIEKTEIKSASEIIQLEVLNGCGIEGVADRFTEFLRNKGFDVVRIDNHTSFDMDETLVIDRAENKFNARKVADALGVKMITEQNNKDYLLDVTVIIGKDYFTLKPIK